MGRIDDPELGKLVAEWSDTLLNALDEVGRQKWPPFKERRGLLAQPRQIIPFSLEGPVQIGSQVCWALSHIQEPSTFDETGALSPGRREYWLIGLCPGRPVVMTIEGAQTVSVTLDTQADWRAALEQAVRTGPKLQTFYGNKGPLSHR